MNAITTHTGIQVPAHLANRIGAAAVALPTSITAGVMAGLGGESVPRISLKGARFRIVENGDETLIPTLHLDVVVVGANPGLSKTWYAQGWSPDQDANAPDCSSDNGIVPNNDSPSKQAVSCAACPQNVWGSKSTDTGQELKACSDHKRIAVCGPDDPSAGIYLLSVTPAALKGLGQYIRQLSQHGIPVECVITRLTFDPAASFPKLVFAMGGFLSAEQQAAVDAAMQDPEGIRNVTRAPDPNAAPVQAPVLAAPAAPAPVPQQQFIPPVQQAAPTGFPMAAPEQAPQPQFIPPVQQAAAPAAAPKSRAKKSGFGGAAAPAAAPTVAAAPPVQQAAVMTQAADPPAVASTSPNLAAEIAALLNPGGAAA